MSQCQLILRQPGQRSLKTRQEDLSRAASPQTPLPSPQKPSAPNDPLLPFRGWRGWALWHQQLRPAVSNWAGGLQCWFAGLPCMVIVQVCIVANAWLSPLSFVQLLLNAHYKQQSPLVLWRQSSVFSVIRQQLCVCARACVCVRVLHCMYMLSCPPFAHLIVISAVSLKQLLGLARIVQRRRLSNRLRLSVNLRLKQVHLEKLFHEWNTSVELELRN